MISKYQKYIEENVFKLSNQNIQALVKAGAIQINNVVQGFNDEVFGSYIEEDNFRSVVINVLYINGKYDLKGYEIRIDTKDENWHRYIIAFCRVISDEIEDFSPMISYNSMMYNVRTVLESLGFFTFTNFDIDDLLQIDKNPLMFIPNPRGHIQINYVNVISLYRKIFKDVPLIKNPKKQNAIYLMYSGQSGLIKIGRSVNPNNREKTLQGQDPKLELIVFWIAPIEIEKKLHSMFYRKRKRGEWFKLDFNDLRKIKQFMNNYQ